MTFINTRFVFLVLYMIVWFCFGTGYGAAYGCTVDLMYQQLSAIGDLNQGDANCDVYLDYNISKCEVAEGCGMNHSCSGNHIQLSPSGTANDAYTCTVLWMK